MDWLRDWTVGEVADLVAKGIGLLAAVAVFAGMVYGVVNFVVTGETTEGPPDPGIERVKQICAEEGPTPPFLTEADCREVGIRVR